MGKTRIIAETGAGQHGVATATVAARFGLPCTIFMGAKDVERQKPNVFRMKLLGAEVQPVTDRKSTRLHSSHSCASRMPSSALKKKQISKTKPRRNSSLLS